MKHNFKRGDRVRVTSMCNSYDKVGTITEIPYSYWGDALITVKLDNGDIRKYSPNSLIPYNATDKGDSEMITGNYRIAMVKFVQGSNTTKKYAFALFDESIKVEDTVLCNSSSGYGVAQVVEIITKDEYEGVTVTNEIVCKVDFTDFEQRKKDRAEAKKLKLEMDKTMKEMQELALYEMMAEKSPELKEMLDKYKALVG